MNRLDELLTLQALGADPPQKRPRQRRSQWDVQASQTESRRQYLANINAAIAEHIRRFCPEGK
jgi:hypothetical protein